MVESSFTKQKVLSPACQSAEEEKDEESQFSEGQLVSAGCQSDDSEISEEIVEGKHASSASIKHTGSVAVGHASSAFTLEFSSLAEQMRICPDFLQNFVLTG